MLAMSHNRCAFLKPPIQAERLIPHRSPMLLIDRLIHSAAGNGVVEAHIRADSIVTDSAGVLAPLAFVELVAQSYAAIKGFDLLNVNEPVPAGYLVGIQSLEVLGQACCGDILSISVAIVGEFEGFAVVDGTVHSPTSVLARTRIKLFVPPAQEGTH